jgi:hypothetical protein
LRSVRAEGALKLVVFELGKRGPSIRQRSAGAQLVFETAVEAEHLVYLRHQPENHI